MATVLTGQDLSLTIGGDVFDAQTISTTFTYTPNREVLETLDGPVYKTLTFEYSLDVNMYSDWGTTDSLAEALASIALSAPDTSIAFTLVCTGPNAQRPSRATCSPRSRLCRAKARPHRRSPSR